MARWERTLAKLLSGESDANINFNDLRALLSRLGFIEHISGSHHIFEWSKPKQHVNIQPDKNGKVRQYQVKQARSVILDLGLDAL